MIKLSVFGTADFMDKELFTLEMDKEKMDVLVVGGKKGPDQMAQNYALNNEIQTQVFLPNYRRFGKQANYHRNVEMIRNSHRILIFWNQRSRGLFNYLPIIREERKSFRTVLY